MGKASACAAGLLLWLANSPLIAATLWEEYDRLIDSRQAVGALGPTLFGDSVNYYTGALAFTTTDASIPGNNALPVGVTRKLAVGHGKGSPSHDYLFADWELDLPNISGVYSTSTGWVSSGTVNQRCSLPGPPPPITFPTVAFQASEYWHGVQLSLPEGGGELLAASRSGGEIQASTTGRTRPGLGGPYYWLTSDWTYVSCLPSVLNGTGEGFLAVTSNGTKYWFNWMATSGESELKRARPGDQPGYEYVYRKRYALYATRAEDRFGNAVTYTYSNAAGSPVRISSISSSDGRNIAFTYNADGLIKSINVAGQVWEYTYGQAVNRWGAPTESKTLISVLQPDLRSWSIDMKHLSAATLHYYDHEPGVATRTCMDPGDVDDSSRSGTITHPSGAVGTFTVAATRFGRSNVLAMCSNVTLHRYWSSGGYSGSTPPNDVNDDAAYYPIAWDSYALVKKEITGPGLESAAWDYTYLSTISWFLDPSGGGLPVCTEGSCIDPVCVSDACAGNTVTEVAGPSGEFTRYTFGNSYRYNEGKLLKTELGTSATDILKTESIGYELAQTGQVYPTPVGVSPQIRSGAGFSEEFPRPQIASATVQDGVTFNSVTTAFDRFARPLSVTRSNSLGYSKSDVTAYHNNLDAWVLGQVATASSNGTLVKEVTYDTATAMPLTEKAFGILQHTLTYNADGTLATVKDGNNQVTTLSSWKRGIPQSILHPDGTSESAAVNDSGWVTAVTDENGYSTGYGYDEMGRLNAIVYPASYTETWNTTTQTFAPVAIAEYGLPAGHWKQTVSTGNARKITYFDALWRPVVTEQFDAADVAGTLSQVVTRYDARSRKVFQSYPLNNLTDHASVTQGARTSYDALDRVTRVEQDSELGVLATKTEYLTGFQTRVTNPRGYQTTTSYQVFDAPSTAAPVSIAEPDNVTTTIVRDGFGKPKSITRTGPGG